MKTREVKITDEQLMDSVFDKKTTVWLFLERKGFRGDYPIESTRMPLHQVTKYSQKIE